MLALQALTRIRSAMNIGVRTFLSPLVPEVRIRPGRKTTHQTAAASLNARAHVRMLLSRPVPGCRTLPISARIRAP
jgi:hypothetical protein